MAPRGQDPNAATFVASDVIGSEGIGHHGELLLDALAATYPPELQAVLSYRENAELDQATFGGGYDARLEEHGKIAKIAGIDEKRVLRAKVRGGADEQGRNRDSSQAWISYVALDDTGDNVFKGVYPFLDHGKGSSDRHFSQLRAAAETPAGQRYLEAALKKKAAEEGTDAPASAPAKDPIEFFRDANASEVVALMEEHPERVDEIKAIYSAVKGSKAAKAVTEYEKPTSEGQGQGSEGGGGEGSGGDPPEGSGDGGGGDPPPAP